jgi:hypothetical protein
VNVVKGRLQESPQEREHTQNDATGSHSLSLRYHRGTSFRACSGTRERTGLRRRLPISFRRAGSGNLPYPFAFRASRCHPADIEGSTGRVMATGAEGNPCTKQSVRF